MVYNALKLANQSARYIDYKHEPYSNSVDFFLPQVFSLLDPKTIDMFHFSGQKHTTPNCPIEMALDFNPSGGASYWGGDKNCRGNAQYYVPFFSARPGPKYEEWSTNAHEGRPGHHTQVSVA